MKASKEEEDESRAKDEMKNESDQSDDNSDEDGNNGASAPGEDAEVRDVIYKLELLAFPNVTHKICSAIFKCQLAVSMITVQCNDLVF